MFYYSTKYVFLKGISGLIIKPIVSIYDFCYAALEGIRNSAKYEENVMDTRSRPPRVFDENGLLINFDNESALAKDVIRSTRYKPIPGETVTFFDLINTPSHIRWLCKKPRQFYVALTNFRFLYIRVSLNPFNAKFLNYFI